MENVSLMLWIAWMFTVLLGFFVFVTIAFFQKAKVSATSEGYFVFKPIRVVGIVGAISLMISVCAFFFYLLNSVAPNAGLLKRLFGGDALIAFISGVIMIIYQLNTKIIAENGKIVYQNIFKVKNRFTGVRSNL